MLRAELRAALLVAAFLVASGSPAAAARVNCEVDAVDAFEAAREADFTFRLVQSNATRCELTESTIVVAAPQNNDVFCRFAIFGGRSTGNGWRLVKLNYSASEDAEVEVTKLQPGWLFDIRAPRARTSLVSVQSVVARGEKCKNWREAFRSDE